MEDRLNECLNELFAVLQGELIIGDHESLSAFASREQQEFGEISKDMTRLFLKQGYDIEIVINSILEELRKFDIETQKRGWNPFVREKTIPKSVLIGHYNATLSFVEKLKVELTLQEAQIIKEETLLENVRGRLVQCVENLQDCLNIGEQTLVSLEGTSVRLENDFEDDYYWKERLQKKINTLHLSHSVAEQSLAQVEMLIDNNRQLTDRIQAITLKTIPIWKAQMQAIIDVVNHTEKTKVNQDFEGELVILERMENLDQKIRDVLKDISI